MQLWLKSTPHLVLMNIRVEFYGIVRQRAGVAKVELPRIKSTSLGDVIAALTERFPLLEGECFEQGRFCPGFICNIDGDRFVMDPDTPLDTSCTLLIMSADAGG